LTNYLAEFTRATAVYVGKIAKPIKGVSTGLKEDCDEKAHVINNANNHIEFVHASKDMDFMVG
jgi:hypothetical protein